jgi:cytidylate kinase
MSGVPPTVVSLAPAIVGFGGSTLSGKSRLAVGVAASLGWPRGSFGDIVRDTARSLGLKGTVPELQRIGEDLVANNAEAFCRRVLSQAGWSPGRPAVLDGVRHVSIVRTLRQITAPQRFVLVLVVASTEVRIERLADRQRVFGDQQGLSLVSIDQHSTERETQGLLRQQADFIVESNSVDQDPTEVVVDWIIARGHR